MRLRLLAALAASILAIIGTAACAGPAASPTATTAQKVQTATAGPMATIPPAASPAQKAPTTAASPAIASPAAAGATVVVAANPKLGNILTDAKGMTLYVYKNDQPNVSNCTDQCAQNWPPLVVTGAPSTPPGFSGTLGTITRADGTKQATYNQMPLYHYARDAQPGDTNGQGIGGVWSVAQPNSP